jgi:hypothetical protein
MGARQIVATFDAGFSSCTANVIEGQGAGGVMERKAPNGKMYQIISATATNVSCSIHAGNAFAN